MWADRIAGIVFGVALGVAIVAVFVFVFSEQTIDSASISPHHAAAPKHPAEPHHRAPGPPKPRAIQATVTVRAGAPPESGPAHVDAHEGDEVTLTIDSDEPVGVELIGYGITRSVPASSPTAIRFKATQAGNFALVNTATNIAVAQLRVSPR
jgi:hypothetical protein